MPTVVTALERLLRGRVLIGLFVFWALFWLVGGVAIVRLLKMDRPAEVIPLQVGQNPEVSGAIGNTASPSPARVAASSADRLLLRSGPRTSTLTVRPCAPVKCQRSSPCTVL